MNQPPPNFRKIEFNALDPKTRQRLVDAIAGTTSPRPVLSAPASTGGAIFGWVVLATIAGAGGLFLAAYDFGNVHGYHQSILFMVGYAVAFFTTAWALLRAVRTGLLASSLPFKRGRYVFPTDMVIATTSELTIVPMGRLNKLDGVHRHVNGVYQGTDLNFYFQGHGHELFTVRGKQLAEQIMNDLRYAQQRIGDAVQHQDWDVLASMDPFFEARITDGWNDPAAAALAAKQVSGDPQAKPVNALFRRAALVSLAAMVLAPPVWFVRNFVSDEAAYSRAQELNTTWAFEGYLRGDGRHTDDVVNNDLPEAAFAEAREEGTVAALRTFVQEHPDSARVGDARAAIHERFVQVRQEFMSQAATGDPRMPAFMGHLLDWLEAHDSPPVLVRFFAPSAQALSEIDQNLDIFGELQGVTGGIAPVSPHFTAERSSGRESHITQVLQRGFAPIFPADVMSLEHSGRIAPEQQNVPLTQPVFDVSYVIRPSGSVYTSDTSERAFVGIHVDFQIIMRIPDSEETYSINVPVEPPEHFTVSSYSFDPTGDSAYRDGLVYSVMADRAFDNLGNQLALRFFRPGTPAYQQAQAAAERDAREEQRRPGGLPPGLPSNLPGVY